MPRRRKPEYTPTLADLKNVALEAGMTSDEFDRAMKKHAEDTKAIYAPYGEGVRHERSYTTETCSCGYKPKLGEVFFAHVFFGAHVKPNPQVEAWERISRHPFFEDCFRDEGSLIEQMIAKLDATETYLPNAAIRNRVVRAILSLVVDAKEAQRLIDSRKKSWSEIVAWNEAVERGAEMARTVNLTVSEQDSIDDLEGIELVRHILSSGYGCVDCYQDDLRKAVGLPPITDHQEHE